MSHKMRGLADEIVEALSGAGSRMGKSLKGKSDLQAGNLRQIVLASRQLDKKLGEGVPRKHVPDSRPHDGSNGRGDHTRSPRSDTDAASFGESNSTNHRDNFFAANPDVPPSDTVVHHAVEQQTTRRYPDVVTPSEMHSPENLRGIPKEINGPIHLSAIRIEWNKFYALFDDLGRPPTKQELLDYATLVDDKFGHLFNPPIR